MSEGCALTLAVCVVVVLAMFAFMGAVGAAMGDINSALVLVGG